MSISPVSRPVGSSVKSVDITFMAANAAGIVLYLLLASRGWRNPLEQGMIPVTGEPFVWVAALPVLGAFVLTDFVWGVLLLEKKTMVANYWWRVATHDLH